MKLLVNSLIFSIICCIAGFQVPFSSSTKIITIFSKTEELTTKFSLTLIASLIFVVSDTPIANGLCNLILTVSDLI